MPIDLSALHLPPELIARLTASTGLKTTISGSAVASGDRTRITGGIAVTTTDDGPVTTVSGEATLTATAQSSDGEPIATAITDINVEGEDVLETATVNSSNTEQSGDLITTTATSTTTVFALDEEVSLPTGTTTTEPVVEPDEVGDEATINGNAVNFGFEIEADGGDAYVGFEATLLTMDEVSSLNVTAFSIA
jgi:Tfp pilus assembly major pilin PilA